MSVRPLGHATYEDLLKVPDTLVAELVEGELFTNPRPRFKHAGVASDLGAQLIGPLRSRDGGSGGWWILDEPELHLGLNVLVPDLGGWRHQRLPELPDSHFTEIAPDWVCEVTSPSTRQLDRLRKMPIYAREGVEWMWILDPDPQTLEVFRNDGGRWIVDATHGGEDVVRAQPFDGIEIDLGRLWQFRAS
jgi:Uma2 family endonuclease